MKIVVKPIDYCGKLCHVSHVANWCDCFPVFELFKEGISEVLRQVQSEYVCGMLITACLEFTNPGLVEWPPANIIVVHKEYTTTGAGCWGCVAQVAHLEHETHLWSERDTFL